MQRSLRILVSCQKDFFSFHEKYTGLGKDYTGATHFTSNFFTYFERTPHILMGVAFENPSQSKIMKIKRHRKEKAPWLLIDFSVPTRDILCLPSGEADEYITDAVDRIAEEFASLKPDVFFLNGFSAKAYLLFRAAVKAGIPVVSAHHGLWFLEAFAHSIIPPEAILRRKAAERDIVALSAKNIFLSYLSKRVFEEYVGEIPPEHFSLIALPYNSLFAEREDIPTPLRKKIRVGMVGRWDPIKNHQAYLVLAKEAKARGLDWEFVAATLLNPKVEALVNIHEEYPEFITVYPHMDPEELREFYRSLDIVVVPSHFETFCGVVMEAMLQGKPVLISPGVGWVDAFEEYGLEHWITLFENPARVLEKIKQVVHEAPPQRLIDDVLRDNSPDAVFSLYEKLFSEVVEEHERSD